MKLNKQQQDKLIAKLNQVWKKNTCEVCEHQNWMIDDTLFELREFHGGRTVLGSGAIKPLITISCTSCGNTKMMNAIQMKLIDPKNPEGVTPEEGDSNE